MSYRYKMASFCLARLIDWYNSNYLFIYCEIRSLMLPIFVNIPCDYPYATVFGGPGGYFYGLVFRLAISS